MAPRRVGKQGSRATLRLSERDVTIFLAMLEAGGHLPLGFIERYFTSRKKAHGRMMALHRAGYVSRRQDAAGGELYYGLTSSSVDIVAARLGCPPRELIYAGAKTGLFHLRHTAEVGQFRIALREACEASGRFDCRILPERRKGGGVLPSGGSRGARAPDLAFCVRDQVKGDYILRLVEVDLATESVQSSTGVGDFASKVGFYNFYYDQGLYNRDYAPLFGCGEFEGFVCLVLAPSAGRLRSLKAAVREASAGDIFWFGLIDDFRSPSAVLEPRWESAAEPNPVHYSLIGNRLKAGGGR